MTQERSHKGRRFNRVSSCLAAIVGVAGIRTLAGCSADESASVDTTAAQTTGDRRIPFSPANDRQLAEFFLEHHEMAIEMAREVIERGQRSDVREFAQEIVDAQSTAVDTLNAALADLTASQSAGEPPSEPHSEADMAHMAMMSAPDLDQMFLLDMITHHAAGLPVAHRAVSVLRHAELQTMAQTISLTQAAEIGRMRAILGDIGVQNAGEDFAEASADRTDFGLVGDLRVPFTPATRRRAPRRPRLRPWTTSNSSTSSFTPRNGDADGRARD